ncbi:MAG: TonB-dependent receptor [Bacteroidia bacterium]|nr:MAG: TonB-dependent receptor [Bacteroidia bacterium]
MSGKRTLRIWSVILYLCFSYAGKAQIVFDEIIISASRQEEKKQETAPNILVINSSKSAIYNPQTSADLLQTSGEVFVQKSQAGGGSPMLRGFAANRILLCVDGIRMNNPIFRSGNLQNILAIDAASVKQTEIIFGPGTVLYGSDALGGVIHIQTLKNTFAQKKKRELSGNFFSRYSSAAFERSSHIDINLKFRRLSFLTSLSFNNYSDVKAGKFGNANYLRPDYVEEGKIKENDEPQRQKFSHFSWLNFLQKVAIKVGKNTHLAYNLYYSRSSDIPRYDRLLERKKGQLKYAQWYYGPQKWFRNDLKFSRKKSCLFFNNLNFVLALRNYEESRHKQKLAENILHSGIEKVRTFSLMLDFQKKIAERNILSYGLENNYSRVFSKAFEQPINSDKIKDASTRYPNNVPYSTHAFYANYKYFLGEKIILSGGLRYTRIFSHIASDNRFALLPFKEVRLNTGAVNGSIGLIYRTRQWLFKTNVASGFRAPNIDDLSKIFDSEPGKLLVPNPDLKPEYAYGAELFAQKKITTRLRFSLSIYYTLLKDALMRSNFRYAGKDSIEFQGEHLRIRSITNKNTAQIYGFQAAADWHIIPDLLFFGTRLSLTRGYDSEHLPIRHAPPLFGSSHLRFSQKKWQCIVYVEYNGKLNYEQLPESEKSKTHIYAKDANGNPYVPRWLTVNLKSSYRINPIIQLDVGIENIMNKLYRPYSSGISAPGRNFLFAVKIKI